MPHVMLLLSQAASSDQTTQHAFDVVSCSCSVCVCVCVWGWVGGWVGGGGREVDMTCTWCMWLPCERSFVAEVLLSTLSTIKETFVRY